MEQKTASRTGKLSKKQQEVRTYLKNLPDESQREYEKQIIVLVMRKQPESFQEVLEALLSDQDEQVAFAAFCALCEFHRRNKDYTEQRCLLELYEQRFQHHPLFPHLKLLYYVDNFDHSKTEEILSLAKENSELLSQNAGAWHALSDLVATAFEYSDFLRISPPDARWMEEGIRAIELAIHLDGKYAKFYCTKARLLALRGEYDESSSLIQKAVDLEDSRQDDYAMRINGYLGCLQKIQFKKQNAYIESRLNQYMVDKMDEYAQHISEQQEELRQQTQKASDELQRSAIKNLEFIGLFAGIISFTIGSISISNSLAERSFTGAAGLIIVLMGTLLCAFSGFGVVLHGIENKKWVRNLIVFLLGLLSTAAGIAICFRIPAV